MGLGFKALGFFRRPRVQGLEVGVEGFRVWGYRD